jgi:hypothetical protein
MNNEELEDLLRHGAATGIVPGLVTYYETGKFYDRYQAEIWDELYEQATSYGTPNIMAFIAEWQTAINIVDEDTFKNYVAWWMVETVAMELLDEAGVGW